MHPPSHILSTNLVFIFHVVPSRAWFENTLRTIRRLYRFVTLKEIESYFADGVSLKNCCHISFDDGDSSVYRYAFPVLREMNAPATLFVSPRIIDGESNYWFQDFSYIRKRLDDGLLKRQVCEVLNLDYNRFKNYRMTSILKCLKLKKIMMVLEAVKQEFGVRIDKKYNMTRAQLDEMTDSGLISVGAHTMNHPTLSNETHEDAEREISHSIKTLSYRQDTNITCFAFPNGIVGLDYGFREETILRDNGITMAFTSETHFFDKNTNPLRIPRCGFEGLADHSALRLSKMLLVPIWDRIGGSRKKEIRERRKILKLLNS